MVLVGLRRGETVVVEEHHHLVYLDLQLVEVVVRPATALLGLRLVVLVLKGI